MPHKRLFFFLTLLLFFLLTIPKESDAMTESTSPTAEIRPFTAAEVTVFVDQFMATQLASLPVPGAAVVVVQGDQILHAQGYGLANIEAKQPVQVDETLFRAGSISKLVTATAVMQLVEQGKIELDGDINRYLTSYQLPTRFDQPVTVADLLLHTAGFDDIFFGMHVRHAEELQPLGRYLADRLPERYLPPGQIISYNDHGYTLAGLLVEEVSGLPFETYVAQHIFQPLGMMDSTFAQPLPSAAHARLAVGYRGEGGQFDPYTLDYVQVAPAAGLIAPASDMAYFMQAHLDGGQRNETAILQPETAALMHTIHVRHHPALRGRSYGFSEWRENGRRALFHDGGNPGFLNRLLLLPDEQVGFFITFNGDQYTPASQLHWNFTTEFLDTFFPEEQPMELPVEDTAVSQPARHYTGYYRSVTGYSHDTLQKLQILTEQFPVQAKGNRLQTFGRSYLPVGEAHYQSVDGESHIAFRENEAGSVSHLFVGTGAYAKLPWYETQPVNIGLAIYFLVSFLVAMGSGLGWRQGSLSLRGTLFAIGLLNLIFLVGIALILLQIDPWRLIYGPTPALLLLLTLPLITSGLTLLLLLLVANGWRSGDWQWGTRLLTAVLTLSLLAFPLFLNLWNLLGFRY